MLRDLGLDIESMSDSSSAIESDVDEEGDRIELNVKIEEMRRVCSVVTL